MNTEKLDKVIAALDKVPKETKQMIFDMSCGLTEQEIIQSFNQQTYDFFTCVASIAKKLQKEAEADGYRALFDNAVKINKKMPIDKFTLMILEYAAEIYAENEDCFIKMSIPDKNVTIGNEFGIIRSEMFKSLWKILGNEDKTSVKEIIILLTTYAHAYLYKSILKNKTSN